MLSALVVFLLLGVAYSNIEFLKPTSGQEFLSNETIQIKWSKVAGTYNYSINGNSSDESNVARFKVPSRCNPRVSIGPLQEGYWSVLVEARNQSGDSIDSGWINFRVCQSLPCPNGSEGACSKYNQTLSMRFFSCIPGFSPSTNAASLEECCAICAAANSTCAYNPTTSRNQCVICAGTASFEPSSPGNAIILLQPKQG